MKQPSAASNDPCRKGHGHDQVHYINMQVNGACPPKGVAAATLAAPPKSDVAPMPGMLTGGGAERPVPANAALMRGAVGAALSGAAPPNNPA